MYNFLIMLDKLEQSTHTHTHISIQKEANEIWNIANFLRKTGWEREDYKYVIIPFLLLRRFSAIASEKKEKLHKILNEWYTKHPSQKDREKLDENYITQTLENKQINFPSIWNTSKLDWNDLINANKNVASEVIDYVKCFPKIIRNIFLKQDNIFTQTNDDKKNKKNRNQKNFDFDATIETLSDTELLVPILNSFNKFDLSPSKIDNQHMGYIFEELIRKFSENKTAGEHYTPREVIKLLTKLALFGQQFEEGKIINVLDACCGTGGILNTFYNEIIDSYANKDLTINLYGQEIVALSFAFCVADILIKGQNPENIVWGSTLEIDGSNGMKYNFVIENPPFGQEWGEKKEIQAINTSNRFPIKNIPKSDIQLFFHQDALHKLDTKGKAVIISNGAPLQNGDACSGESEWRKMILENDWLETLIALPSELFYNTGIPIYIWVYNKNKPANRKNKIQLIDAKSDEFCSRLPKGLGQKRNELKPEHINKILNLYKNYTNDIKQHSLVFDKDEFFYKKVPVYCAYQRDFMITDERITNLENESQFTKLFDEERFNELSAMGDKLDEKQLNEFNSLKLGKDIQNKIKEILKQHKSHKVWNQYQEFSEYICSILKNVLNIPNKYPVALATAIVHSLSEHNVDAPILMKKNKPEIDKDLKDVEYIPMGENNNDYFEKEVKPFLPNSWMETDDSKIDIGVEFSFSKYFFKKEVLEPTKELSVEIQKLDKELAKLEGEIYE